MPINLYWEDDAQTMILCEFEGKWTWDELRAVLWTVKKLSMERNQVFGAIIDLRKGLQLPGGSVFNREGLAQFNKLLKMGEGGKGPVVILGMNGMVRAIFDAVARIDRSATQDVHFASTIDEAHGLLQQDLQTSTSIA